MSRLPWNFAPVKCRVAADCNLSSVLRDKVRKKKKMFAATENEEQTDGGQKYQERL